MGHDDDVSSSFRPFRKNGGRGLKEGALVELLHTHCPPVVLAAAKAEQVTEAASKVAVVHGVDDRVQHRVGVASNN
jgi:hypothetical protein